MQLKNYNTYFFFIVLFGVSVMTFFILKPFLLAIVMAVILAIVFQRPYAFFQKLFGGRNSLAAFATTIAALFVIVVPFLIILGLMANELLNLYQNVLVDSSLYQRSASSIFQAINSSKLFKSLGLEGSLTLSSFTASFAAAGQWAIDFAKLAYASIAHSFFVAFMVLFSLYYFLIEGKEVVKKIMYISPLRNEHEKMLIGKFISISRATIKGTIVMGIMQGTLGGITFLLAGVPSAITWSVVMMVFSIIPFVGSSIVWFPVGIILLLIGKIWQGALILGVGIFVISSLDNFLRPKLVGRDTQMHPLLVLFSTVGGIILFGFSGFIVGPVIMALFVSLWEIYAVEFKAQLKRYNR